MQKPTFDYFWTYVVSPSIRKCINEVDEDVSKKIKLNKEEDSQYKLELSEMFKRKREWLKREYLSNEDDPTLDFHKFAALLCRSVIGNKPFSFSLKEAEECFEEIAKDDNLSNADKLQWEIDNIYINYKCAFFIAKGVSYIDLFYWAIMKCKSEVDPEKKEIYNEFQKRLNQRKDLENYKKSPNHDDFSTSMIVSLMKNDILMRDFDYLTFSASMFQWQEHTKLTILIDIVKTYKNIQSEDLLATIQDLM